MVSICCYFQVHQPYRLGQYQYFDIGHNHHYYAAANKEILHKVANKCYLPMNGLLLKLIDRYQGAFKIAFSISGVLIEQLRLFYPEVLDSFKRLAQTGCVELINETYYHSLSFLYSKDEFLQQLALHRELIEREFGQQPTTFRNTELIYNNEIAQYVENLGYKTILAEGSEKILQWRSPNFIYRPSSCQRLKLLLRNYRLSDDIAFRFSNRAWQDYPLTAEKFAHWLHAINGNGQLINLFMDYETFGEHQWQDTGIFAFMEALPEYVLKHPDYCFSTPSEISQLYEPLAELNVPEFMSWADTERDLTAWCGNDLQQDALHSVYTLENKVKQTNDKELIQTWRSLLTSDHFYYMCTKWFSDGDVHKYFNPYDNPYEGYMIFQNVLTDLSLTLDQYFKDASA